MCMIPTSVKNSTIVKLRGVCKFSAFDKEYQVAVSPEGEIIYYGLARTIISYNHSMEAWKIIDVINPNIFGIFTAGFSGLALGTNKWTISNDKCKKGKHMVSISLTTCKDSSFTCDDGLCIDLPKRCNGVTDCKDKSDEDDKL